MSQLPDLGLRAAGIPVSHGLLHENLFFDASSIEFVWKKTEQIIPGWQKEESPTLWENSGWLANHHQTWKKTVWTPNQKWESRARQARGDRNRDASQC